MAVLKPCLGCGQLTRGSRCSSCRRAYERQRGTSTQRGYGAKWKRVRAAFLSRYPDCAHCGGPASQVHHLDGLGPTGPYGYADFNLQSCCASCHSRITARSQRRVG